MRLQARQGHRYYHRASRVLYLFAAGEEREVPDDVGQVLLTAHPDKFAVVGGGGGPVVTTVEEAPRDGMVRRRRSPRSRRSGEEEAG